MDLQAIHKNIFVEFSRTQKKEWKWDYDAVDCEDSMKMLMMEETITFSLSLFIALVLLNGIMNQR